MKRSQPFLSESPFKFLKTIRRIFYIGLIVSLCSCGQMIYTYKFSMKESQKPRKLYYQNDTLSITFQFYLEGLVIDFYNKSPESIKVNWDGIVMTTNEVDKKIQHTIIVNEEYFVYQPPSIILPKSGCTDLVVFAESVYYQKDDGEEKMKIKNMYPGKGKKREGDSIRKLIGQRITLLFPIEINNVSHSWVFNFLLADIKSKRQVSAGDVISGAVNIISF